MRRKSYYAGMNRQLEHKNIMKGKSMNKLTYFERFTLLILFLFVIVLSGFMQALNQSRADYSGTLANVGILPYSSETNTGGLTFITVDTGASTVQAEVRDFWYPYYFSNDEVWYNDLKENEGKQIRITIIGWDNGMFIDFPYVIQYEIDR